MPVFEPSTWAEVEEALISRKPAAQTSDTFVQQVRAFTNAPERFLATTTTTASTSDQSHSRDRLPRLADTLHVASSNNPPTATTDTKSSSHPSTADTASRERERDRDRGRDRRHPPHVKRSEVQFDDLLGHGRVDLETQSFVRRYNAPANFKNLAMFPASSPLQRRNPTTNSDINPSSTAFRPSAYLAKVHRESTIDQLVAGKAVLQNVKQHLDTQADAYRSEKFVSAALVESAFESTKSSLRDISPFADGSSSTRTPALDFARAETVLKVRYEDVMQRESKLAQLQRTLAIYKRYQWVFTLAPRLRAAVNEDVTAIEQVVREYQRAVKWIQAQDDADLDVISQATESGFQVLFNALLTRLSSGHLSRQETMRLVAVLVSVKREDLLTEALSKRMAHALDGLRKAVRSVDIAAIVTVRGTGKVESDVADLVSRASVAFVEGVSHVWRLGRVLMSQERWTRPVDTQLSQLCAAYAQVLREHLLTDVSLLSPKVVRQIAAVRGKILTDLQIAHESVLPLDDVIAEVVELFFKALANGVRLDAEQAAIRAVRNDTIGAPSAQLVCDIATEALGQVDVALVQGLHGSSDDGGGPASVGRFGVREDDAPPSSLRVDGGTPGSGPPTAAGVASSAEVLAVACAEAPAIFAQEVHERMLRTDVEADASALKVAVCCTEMCRSVIDRIRDKLQISGVQDLRAAYKQTKETLEAVRSIQEKSIARYVELVSRSLRDAARALVSFPEDERGDSVSRTVPIKIEGVSKGVSELTLQLALITISTRRRSANKGLIEHILLELIREIGATLVDVLSTDKVAYDRAAQLWVDVTFVQDMVTRGADGEREAVQKALDGFARVKERAVQAVLADGFSFSLADMQTLRETVITAAVKEAIMVCECFQETWAFVRRKDDS